MNTSISKLVHLRVIHQLFLLLSYLQMQSLFKQQGHDRSVRDDYGRCEYYECSQGPVMNAHRNFYSVVVIYQLKKTITISTRYWRSVQQEKTTNMKVLLMTNKEVNDNCSRTLSSICYWQMWLQCNLLGVLHSGSFLGKAATRLSQRLGQGGWVVWVDMTLPHIIPHTTRKSRDPLHTSLLCPEQLEWVNHDLVW